MIIFIQVYPNCGIIKQKWHASCYYLCNRIQILGVKLSKLREIHIK
jgi:hypothetical protein